MLERAAAFARATALAPLVHRSPAHADHGLLCSDSLASVALKHGMRPDQLKRWNKLLSPSLFPGQTLLVLTGQRS